MNKAITIGLIGLMILLGLQATKEAPGVELVEYLSFTGTITDLRDGEILVRDDQNAENEMIFVLTEETLLLDESEQAKLGADKLEEGQVVTAYYPADLPMALSYPARLGPSVLVRRSPEGLGFIHVATFDDTLTSSDGSLKIRLGAGMTLSARAGKPVTSLANRNLVVFYAESTRSIPAQTTPETIIVF